MRHLFLHGAMEHLQHLIVRRACNNVVSYTEVIHHWQAIQEQMTMVLHEMEIEHKATVDALSPQTETRNQSMVGSSGCLRPPPLQ